MPYEIRDAGKPGPKRYAILKKETGRVVAHSASRVKAQAYTRMAHRGEKTLPAMSVVDASAGGSLVGPPSFGAPGRPRRKLRPRTKDFNPSEGRDDHGRFSGGGGGAATAGPPGAAGRLAAAVEQKLARDVKKMSETEAGRATLAKGQALAQKVKGGIAAGVKAALDGLDKESRGGVSLIAGGLAARSPAAVAQGAASIFNSVFTCVHEEIFENALSQHSVPGAHAVGMVAATVAAKAEQGLLKAVSWALAKATGKKTLDGVLWTKSADQLTDADRQLLARLAGVAAGAVREVLAAAGVPDAQVDEQAAAARIAELLRGAAGSGRDEPAPKAAAATPHKVIRPKAKSLAVDRVDADGGPVLGLPEVVDVLRQRGGGCQLDKDLHGADAFGLDSPAVGETRFDDGAMAISYVFAASQGRDRVGDFLEVEGIWTAKHEKNPVAYLDHGKWCRWPIGKDVDPSGRYTVVIDPDSGLASCTTYLSQSLPEAVQAYQLYREGILKAGSIGYRPMKAKKLPPDPSLLLPAGLHLLEVELIETTLTGLPMNGDCARKALEMRLDGGPILPALRAMIEPHADPRKVWANGSNLTPQGTPAMKTKDIQPTNPGDPAAAPAAAADPAAAPNPAPEADPKIPHGAQTLGDIYQALEAACQVIKEETPRLDNDAVEKFLEKLVPQLEKVKAGLAGAFAKEYPDLEPLQEEAGDDDEEEDDDDEENDDEEQGKSWRPRHKGLRRKGAAGAVRAPAVPVEGKALSKGARGVVGKAAEFLDEHKDADNLSYDQKVLVGHHAEALKSIAGGGEGGDDDMSPEEKALVLSAIGSLQKNLEASKARLDKALGRK